MAIWRKKRHIVPTLLDFTKPGKLKRDFLADQGIIYGMIHKGEFAGDRTSDIDTSGAF